MSNNTVRTLTADAIEGLISNRNYLKASFESQNIYGYSLFNTTLTSLIPTGTITAGASSITTFTTTATNPLSGTYSLSVASSGAITAGQGFISDTFTIDNRDKAKVLSFSFDYSVVSGSANLNFSGTSTNTFQVYIYDVTNSAWIQPAGVYNLVQNSLVGNASGTFQTTSNSTQYRLAVICINASGGAVSLTFDGFKLGQQVINSGSISTDWVAYTPTFTGFGTPSSIEFESCRSGSDLLIRGKFISGTTTATEARITLGFNGVNGNVVSASSPILPSLQPAGGVSVRSGSGTDQVFPLIEPNVNYLTFGVQGTAAGLTKSNANGFTTTANTFAFTARVPIAGWSSNVIMSNDTDTRVVAARYNATASTTIAASGVTTNINFDSKVIDTHNAVTTGSGWRFTAPVSGQYSVKAAMGIDAPGASVVVRLLLYKNGSGSAYNFTQYVTQPTGEAAYINIADIIQLNAGDYIEIRGSNNSASTSVTTSTNAVAAVNVAIERISGPATIASSESVIVKYQTSGSRTPTTTKAINFDTKLKDTHSAVTTVSGDVAGWKFTAPISGSYFVSVTYNPSVTSSATMYIYLNGSQSFPIGNTISGGTQGGSTLMFLNAGDFIDIRNDGAPTLTPTTPFNHISIYRVGQ